MPNHPTRRARRPAKPINAALIASLALAALHFGRALLEYLQP